MASSKKELRELVQGLEGQGWRVQVTNAGHYRLACPCGRHLVFAARSPSDHRTIDNTRSQLRRSCATGI